jgi:hypothetical protein
MKNLFMTVALFASITAQSSDVTLDSNKFNYGALTQETNAAANELIVIKRTAATPKKVVLSYSVNFMEKKCTSYDVKVEEIKEFSQVVCEYVLDGSHVCQSTEYTGLYNAKTVCVQEGLVRSTSKKEITLDFRRSVKLAPNASETFQVNLRQASITNSRVESKGKALVTASLYNVIFSFGKLKFKAK